MYFTDPDGNGIEIYVDTRNVPGGQQLWKGVNVPIAEQELREAIEAATTAV
jgi:catechol-2,3-dioxygenase